MKRIQRRLAILGICTALTATALTGCGTDYRTHAGETIAMLDGENISYALVNFSLRYNQAQMQSAYGALFGVDMWNSYGETTRTGAVDAIEQMMILEKHMEEYDVTISDEDKGNITEAATAFMQDNDRKVLEAMTASQGIVERMLTLQLIGSRMRTAIIADTDREVSDEEAAQKTIQYALFSTAATMDAEGNTIEKTEEEKTTAKNQAEQVLEAVLGGEELDAAIKEVDESRSSSTASYGEGDETLDEAVKTAADTLEEDEFYDSIIEAENGYYVIMMQTTFDEMATENKKAALVTERENALFDEVYEGWREASEFTVDDTLVATLDFADIFSVKARETEMPTEAATEAGTEAGTETETGTETEEETETGTETETEEETETETETETDTETED